MRQLIASHIPDVGSEVKVTEAEVTVALKKRGEVEIFIPGKPNNFFTIGPLGPLPLLALYPAPWGVAFAGHDLIKFV